MASVRGTIVATDPGDLTAPAVATLRARGHLVDVLPPDLSPDAAAEAAADAEILLVGIVPVPASAISRLRAVRLIVRCGAGTDTVDLAAATAGGIMVANVPDYCIDEVADHAILLLLAASRHLTEFTDQLRTRPWIELEYPPVRRLRGRTLGLVGFGRIGAAVAGRARAFGLEILVHDPLVDPDAIAAVGGRAVDFETLLAESDLVSLHCPLTPSTHHLLDGAAFSRMRRGVVIVNTSRGALIDLDALEAAFASGVVAAAGLDVLDGEPVPDLGHPLLRRRSVLVTPHIAFYSLDAQADLGRRVADEVERFRDGLPPRTLVNRPTPV